MKSKLLSMIFFDHRRFCNIVEQHVKKLNKIELNKIVAVFGISTCFVTTNSEIELMLTENAN